MEQTIDVEVDASAMTKEGANVTISGSTTRFVKTPGMNLLSERVL